MSGVVIGLDTSCYTTSCAAVTLSGQVLASCRRLLPVAAGQRGLRQSDAVFAHVRQLPALLEELSAAVGQLPIAAVCASRSPRDGEDSYMPVFQVGWGQAQGLASLLHVPCYATTHQRGHVAAASLDCGLQPGPLLAVHLSGGTTELLSLQGESLCLLGGTMDLHAGQLVDRCGVALGLSFPAGPQLEELALRGRAEARLPLSFQRDGLHMHLSGAETQVQRWIAAQSLSPEDIAREVYDFLARCLCRLLLNGARQTGIRQALVAGGVASSQLLRQLCAARLQRAGEDLRLCFGRPEYSGDNAVGVALLGAARHRQQMEAANDSTDD